MERAAVQPTRHWAIVVYFQRTSENILILRRVSRPRRIYDIYDLFSPYINLLTYLLTYLQNALLLYPYGNSGSQSLKGLKCLRCLLFYRVFDATAQTLIQWRRQRFVNGGGQGGP